MRNQYIVVLASTDDAEAVGLETAGLYRGRLRHVYRRAVHGFSIRLDAAAAAALANDPRVAYIEEDGTVRASDIESPAPWGLDRIDQRGLPLTGSYSYGPWTASVNVHVIDTGVRTTHVEFGGRAFNAGDYVDDDGDGDPSDVGNDDNATSTPDGEDCNGHGTHVAATIGGATYGVAKHVTLWSHRVLDCTGTGTISAVIAAVDVVTASPLRPAVVNMSLGADPSDALDAAVRRSIAAGVTYVVAAGNSAIDASNQSPARVAEAITVGATASNDARAGFSNFGPLVDVFAPGVAIPSAWYTSDTDTATLSGTSMAAPHVTGVVALYLEQRGNRPPADVQSAVINHATQGVVTSGGAGSPNRLLFANIVPTPPAVAVTRPNGGEKIAVGSPLSIEWTASDADGLARFDVMASMDNGATYVPVSGCTGLDGSRRQCTWTVTGAPVAAVRVAVTARDVYGDAASDASDAAFSIVAATSPAPANLPSPWSSVDVGSVGAVGGASFASGTFTIAGAGADVWGTTDAMRFVYQPLSGDGTIVARVASVQNVAPWTKAAVTIRETLSPNAANAAMLVSAAKGLSFQQRAVTSGVTTATLTGGAAPAWIKLSRTGSTFTASRSSDGVAWTVVGSTTIAMARDVFVGLFVTSHTAGQLASAAFDKVAVAQLGAPVGASSFHTADIGSVGVGGSAQMNAVGGYSLSGAGADVWGTADAFRYMYDQVTGDWDIETRVGAVDAVHGWTKAGVMIRESLQPDAAYAFVAVTPAKGVALQYRSATAVASAQANVVSATAPQWVKLSRRGSQVSAFRRTDAGTWQPLGSVNVSLSATVYVGVAVSSHDATRAATATFDNLVIAPAP